jgi:hypothetical protein
MIDEDVAERKRKEENDKDAERRSKELQDERERRDAREQQRSTLRESELQQRANEEAARHELRTRELTLQTQEGQREELHDFSMVLQEALRKDEARHALRLLTLRHSYDHYPTGLRGGDDGAGPAAVSGAVVGAALDVTGDLEGSVLEEHPTGERSSSDGSVLGRSSRETYVNQSDVNEVLSTSRSNVPRRQWTRFQLEQFALTLEILLRRSNLMVYYEATQRARDLLRCEVEVPIRCRKEAFVSFVTRLGYDEAAAFVQSI